MDILKIDGFTREIGKPDNWDDAANGPCDSLAVLDVVAHGVNYMISEWKPTEVERAAIAAGCTIKLWVSGTVHPVVALDIKHPLQ